MPTFEKGNSLHKADCHVFMQWTV